MMLRDPFEPMAATLILQGKRPDTLVEEDYRLASAELLDQLTRLGIRYGTDDQVKDGLLSGDVWAAMCYNGDAAFAADQDPRIDFFIPREGTTLWVDVVAIARDTKSPGLAHQLVNFLLDPGVAAENATAVRYATPNEAAVPLVDVELRNDPRIFPPGEILARCSFVPVLDRERDALLHRHWSVVQREFVAREQGAGDPGVLPIRE
jgi:spermidine/putrescine-binding protein